MTSATKKFCFRLAVLLGLIGLFPVPAAADTPVEVKDSTGRTLKIDRVPERIACLYAFCGHVVTMLDRGPDMVAIVNGLKKDLLLNQLVPTIEKMTVPSKGGIINIETLMKTRPDIVFLKPETANIDAEIKKLDRFHLPWFTAGYNNMAEQMTIIEMMGKAIGRFEKAKAYTDWYRDTIRRVKERTDQIPNNERIRLYHAVNEANRTDGPGTLEADWTRACGVINVSVGSEALKKKSNKFFTDIEQILLWGPEVIIVNENGIDRQILTDKKWAPVTAVKNKKVYPIPVGISRWGHPGGLETPLAVLWTAKTVYPQYFTDIDLEKEVTHFYKQFFNMDLSGQMVQKILSGQGMRKPAT